MTGDAGLYGILTVQAFPFGVTVQMPPNLSVPTDQRAGCGDSTSARHDPSKHRSSRFPNGDFAKDRTRALMVRKCPPVWVWRLRCSP